MRTYLTIFLFFSTLAHAQHEMKEMVPIYNSASKAVFEFPSDEPVECRLDNAPFEACITPVRFANKTDGKYLFVVRTAKEKRVILRKHFIINTIAPTITMGVTPPPKQSSGDEAVFKFFVQGYSSVNAECYLDNQIYEPCKPNDDLVFKGLLPRAKPYEFRIKATDKAGNESMKVYSWTVTDKKTPEDVKESTGVR